MRLGFRASCCGRVFSDAHANRKWISPRFELRLGSSTRSWTDVQAGIVGIRPVSGPNPVLALHRGVDLRKSFHDVRCHLCSSGQGAAIASPLFRRWPHLQMRILAERRWRVTQDALGRFSLMENYMNTWQQHLSINCVIMSGKEGDFDKS